MRTFLRGKVTLLFIMLGLLLAIPAVALADTLIITNDITLATSNTNATKNPGDTGTAYVRLDVTNGTPAGDTNGCNASGTNPLTVELKSNNADVTFPGGDTALVTGCGVPVGVSYAVASGSQGGTAVISVDTYSGGRTDGTRLYLATDTMTVTITKPTSITDVSGTGTSGNPGSANLTAKLSSGTDDMSGKTISFAVNPTAGV